MLILKSSDYKAYSKFIESLAKKLTKFYYSNLNRPFKISNKLKGIGYDPVTSADKAFEKFIRKEIGRFWMEKLLAKGKNSKIIWQMSTRQSGIAVPSLSFICETPTALSLQTKRRLTV